MSADDSAGCNMCAWTFAPDTVCQAQYRLFFWSIKQKETNSDKDQSETWS